MRIYALAGIAFLLCLNGAMAQPPADKGWQAGGGVESGIAAAPGADGRQAVYLRSTRVSSGSYGTSPYSALSRTLPAEAWRGKRVRLSLLVKDEGDRRSSVSVFLLNTDGSGLTIGGTNLRTGTGWQVHQYVADVPDTAEKFVLDVPSRNAAGTTWVDGPILVAVSHDVPVTRVRRLNTVTCEMSACAYTN